MLSIPPTSRRPSAIVLREGNEVRRAQLPSPSPPPPPPPYDESPQNKSTLNITQKFEKKLAHLNASENILKRWLVEIITWVISALCMGGIVVTLLVLNGSGLRGRAIGLTVYAVLSKIMSAALILPTSEALGQLKWDWFSRKKSKEIWDFEIFDKASRGPWGSFMLLLRTKGRSLAALGALLTLLLIANDTFLQQVVNLPERWILDENISTIARTVFWQAEEHELYRASLREAFQSKDVQATALKFMFANGTQPIAVGNGTRPEIPLTCPGINCTWPPYETLGVCSSCVDASELLGEHLCLKATADWISNLTGTTGNDGTRYPNATMCGYFLNSTSQSPIMVSGYLIDQVDAPEGTARPGETLLMRILPMTYPTSRYTSYGGSIHFKNIRHRITDFLVTSAIDGLPSVSRNETPIIQECMLAWCIKSVESSYYMGAYREKIIGEFFNNTIGPSPWKTWRESRSGLNGTMTMYLENITFDGTVVGRNYAGYGLYNRSALSVVYIFDDITPAFTTIANATTQPVVRHSAFVKGPPYLRSIQFNPWIHPNNITLHMERLATGITNLIRSTNPTLVSGSSFTVETFIFIQWAWLAFPTTLLILTFVFLVATMVKTSREGRTENGPGVWKTSAMPALIYGLPSDMQGQFSSSTMRSSSENTENIRIKLHPKKGWRVSGRPRSPGGFGGISLPHRANQAPPGWI